MRVSDVCVRKSEEREGREEEMEEEEEEERGEKRERERRSMVACYDGESEVSKEEKQRALY